MILVFCYDVGVVEVSERDTVLILYKFYKCFTKNEVDCFLTASESLRTCSNSIFFKFSIVIYLMCLFVNHEFNCWEGPQRIIVLIAIGF